MTMYRSLLLISGLCGLVSCNSNTNTPTPTPPPVLSSGHAILNFNTDISINATSTYNSNLPNSLVTLTTYSANRELSIGTGNSAGSAANLANIKMRIPNQFFNTGSTNIPVIFGNDTYYPQDTVKFVLTLNIEAGTFIMHNFVSDSGTVSISLLNAAECKATFSGRLTDINNSESVIVTNGFLHCKF